METLEIWNHRPNPQERGFEPAIKILPCQFLFLVTIFGKLKTWPEIKRWNGDLQQWWSWVMHLGFYTLPETNKSPLKLGFMGFLRVSLVIYGMKPWDLWDEANKSPLKIDGWRWFISCWDSGLFSGSSGAFAASFREGTSIFFDCFTKNRIQFSYPAKVIYSFSSGRSRSMLPFKCYPSMQGIA